jgi:hypothetical protein
LAWLKSRNRELNGYIIGGNIISTQKTHVKHIGWLAEFTRTADHAADCIGSIGNFKGVLKNLKI